MISAMGSATDAQGHDQTFICESAASASARGNPAGPGLSTTCTQLRGENIAAGDLILDAMSVDGAMRVFLTDTGKRIIAGEPALRAVASKLTPEIARGFAIGVKVARARGGLSQAYASKVRATLSGENAKGFDLGISAGSGSAAIKAVLPGTSTDIPTPLLIGGGVVALAAVAAVLYKLRKRR